MSDLNKSNPIEEKLIHPINGMGMLFFSLALMAGSIFGIIFSVRGDDIIVFPFVLSLIVICIIAPILLCGLKVINPNEAGVYTLFGKYYGTIATPGFYWINPFCSLFNPTVSYAVTASGTVVANNNSSGQNNGTTLASMSKKVSLKAVTLNNNKQKINDMDGNPIEVGVVVIWKVTNATKAVFEVDNYKEYVSIQCDASLRHVVREFPYDIANDKDGLSLRGSSAEVAEILREDLQNRVDFAGVQILEARIAHLAYAQEIAAAMLQRQQASAIIDARQKIVEGAVGMVEMALDKLSENNIVNLDEERKAAMVSNLLVVLCSGKDTQPIVNSGSLY